MQDTLSEVKKILGKFAKNKPALETAGPSALIRDDLGVSSANLVDVLLQMEETFDISISDNELEGINTLGDAVKVIDGKKGAS